MKRLLIGLTFIFYVFSVAMQSVHADIVVVTNKDKIPKFVLDTSTGQVTAVNGVYVEGGDTTPPAPPVDPDDPDPPTETAATKAAREAATRIGIKQDAATLAAVYQFFADQLISGTMDVAGFKKSFGLARGMAGPNLKGNWTDELKILDAFIDEPMIGNLIRNLTNLANGFAAYAETTPQKILNSKEGAGDPQNLDIGSILALLQIILEFLRAIGVIK